MLVTPTVPLTLQGLSSSASATPPMRLAAQAADIRIRFIVGVRNARRVFAEDGVLDANTVRSEDGATARRVPAIGVRSASVTP